MSQSVTQPQPLLEELNDFQTLLKKMGQRDRVAIEKHIIACEAEPSSTHAELWKNLAVLLAQLVIESGTPVKAAAGAKVAGKPRPDVGARQFAVQATGQRAVQFFAPDGKYRRQIFALEDLRDGTLAIYAIDVLKEGLRQKTLTGPHSSPAGENRSMTYRAGGAGSSGLNIDIEMLTASSLVGAPEYYRHMVGWNRTAMRIILKIEGIESSGSDPAESLRALTPFLRLSAGNAVAAVA